MSPITKVTLTTIVLGLLSAVLFAGCAQYLFFRVIAGMFGGGLRNPFLDISIVVLCVIGVLLSLAICPLWAFYLRGFIFGLSPSTSVRVLIFSIISGFQILLVTVGYFSFSAYANMSAARNREKLIKNNEAHHKILEELKRSQIEIVAEKARVISDKGKFVVVEVTLQIHNMPLVVPSYNLSLARTRNGDGISYDFYNFPDGPDFARSLKAKNDGGKWIFYKDFTEELISDSNKEITIQIEITGLDSSMLPVTTTITPQCSIWREETGYWRNSLFWRESIPITIEGIN